MQDKMNKMQALINAKDKKIKKLTEEPVVPIGEFVKKL
jgi:hypothetical protein